jgi:hypothetical protein
MRESVNVPRLVPQNGDPLRDAGPPAGSVPDEVPLGVEHDNHLPLNHSQQCALLALMSMPPIFDFSQS